MVNIYDLYIPGVNTRFGFGLHAISESKATGETNSRKSQRKQQHTSICVVPNLKLVMHEVWPMEVKALVVDPNCKYIYRVWEEGICLNL